MPETPLLNPALYDRGSESTAPALIGGKCTACGYAFFPLKSYGCEVCGSVDLVPTALAGRGHVVASTTVHLHAGKGRQAPFVVGTIALDDGPVVRTLLSTDEPLPVGATVVTHLIEVQAGEPAETALDLRFRETR